MIASVHLKRDVYVFINLIECSVKTIEQSRGYSLTLGSFRSTSAMTLLCFSRSGKLQLGGNLVAPQVAQLRAMRGVCCCLDRKYAPPTAAAAAAPTKADKM